MTGTLIAAGLLVPALAVAQPGQFTSADAADAAERLSGRRVHMSGDIRRLAGAKLAGPAVTVRLVRDDQASLTAEGLKAIRAVEEAPQGSVVVVCGDGNKDFAVFGPTFATLARSRGVAGFVVDGGMRGGSELREIGVPVFARGLVSGSAGGHYRLDGVNVRVTCAGVDIQPADLVVADEDGVVVIPSLIAASAVEKAIALRREKEELLPLIASFRSYTVAVDEYRKREARRQAERNKKP